MTLEVTQEEKSWLYVAVANLHEEYKERLRQWPDDPAFEDHPQKIATLQELRDKLFNL